MPSIKHPLNTTNFTIVGLPFGSVAYSYETMIGFQISEGWKVSENQWGPTTGKHLNYLDDGNKKERIVHSDLVVMFYDEIDRWAILYTKSKFGLPDRLFDNTRVAP